LTFFLPFSHPELGLGSQDYSKARYIAISCHWINFGKSNYGKSFFPCHWINTPHDSCSFLFLCVT